MRTSRPRKSTIAVWHSKSWSSQSRTKFDPKPSERRPRWTLSSATRSWNGPRRREGVSSSTGCWSSWTCWRTRTVPSLPTPRRRKVLQQSRLWLEIVSEDPKAKCIETNCHDKRLWFLTPFFAGSRWERLFAFIIFNVKSERTSESLFLDYYKYFYFERFVLSRVLNVELKTIVCSSYYVVYRGCSITRN